MDGSRRSAQAEQRDAGAVTRAVARSLAAHVAPGARIAVALSGGRDSVALLTAVLACRHAVPLDVVAIHVHHGLSRNADDWAAFCARLAASHDIELVTQRVRVDGKSRGVEEAARSARYEALATGARAANATAVLLAHHQDDQAETLLLQLGRGAGPHGLSGMPATRRDATGLIWLRPLLDVPRATIEAFVRQRALRYVDDDSNASARHRRNALRQTVVPPFAAAMPGYPATLARAAAHQADAARLADDLAALDAAGLTDAGTLDREGLVRLPAYRGRNLLRYFLRMRGLRAPSTARLAAMLDQLGAARADARVRLSHDGVIIGIHRGRIVVHGAALPAYRREWNGEASLDLPHGRLLFTPALGDGVAQARITGHRVVVRARAGGERVQLDGNRPRRALKSWLQEAGIPHWQRDRLPLVFCDDVLAAVPGLGIATDFAAAPGTASLRIDWKPAEPP